MDLTLSFKKYIENSKVAFAYSILFIFLLFIIDPVISIFGGTLNLSYTIINAPIANIVIILIATIILMFIYSLLQSLLIYKIGTDYHFSGSIPFKKIKNVFYKLLKFNYFYFILVFLISAVFYELNILNNIIVQLIFLIISISLWFVPQIIVMENEDIPKSMLLSIKYFSRNWFHFITLFLTAFILVIITTLIDVLLPGVSGIVVSTGLFIVFVVPFLEILKTEIYLNKYNLLKPRHQLK